MKIYLLTIPTLFFFLASCAPNPADDVAKAEVTEPVEEAGSKPAEPAKPTEAAASIAPADKAAEAAAPEPAADSAAGEAVAFTLTPESKLGFVGSKVTGSHDGGFKKFTGSFQVDVANKKLAADGKHVVEIDMNSTWSDDDKLTGHLKSPDFFDVEKFPTARFVLTKATETKDGYELSGTLDFHGVKKGITFPATVTVADDEKSVSIKAEFAINRTDFGVVFPGRPDDLIREEVVIRFDVVGVPAA